MPCATAPTPEAPFVNLKKRLKEFARSDARDALVQSVVQCAGLALSAKSLAGLLAAPAAIAGPENAAVIATMKVVYDEVKSLEGLNSDPINDLQAKADACGSTLIWFFFAYKTFSDPPATGVDEVPVPGTVTLAPPPSLCASSAGSAHAACLTLVSDEEAVTLALARVASAYGAVSTAIDRLSQAQATNDASASALQSAALEALQLELAQNLDSLTATERTLGALLHHYFGRLEFPASATRQIAAYVRGQLGHLGIPASETASEPGGLSFVSELNQPQASSGAEAIAHSITPAGVKALVAALTSGASEAKLDGDIAAARWKRFVADAAGLGDPAGQLLSFAGAPLAGERYPSSA